MEQFTEDQIMDIQDLREAELHETNMYEDLDYALEYYADQILEATDILQEVAARINNYGHEVSIKELLEYT